MKMSNSSLVTYTKISPHKTVGRGGNKIQKIMLHHMAGNLTVMQCGNVFQKYNVSCHYGVSGSSVGLYCNESDTAYHAGVWSYNQKCVGIEMANSGGSPNWNISDATIEKTCQLVADIAYRNGLAITYTGGTGGTLIYHSMVASTACPGPYAKSKMSYIAKRSNEILAAKRNGKLTVDGVWGTQTSIKFQKYLGVTQDGIFGIKSIKAMQKWLGVTQDGIIGPKTVKALQKKLGVTQDGICGPKTIKALQTFLNNH